MAATHPKFDVKLPDPYWAAAAEAALRALGEAKYVLVPAEFLPLDRRFAPLEYAWALEGMERLAWCCSKDDVDRIAPWLLDGHGQSSGNYAWANEVFVLGGNFRWRKRADGKARRHLVAWFERIEHYRRGVPSRPAKERPAVLGDRTTLPAGANVPSDSNTATASAHTLRLATRPARRALIVGASGMGNVGDDLLAGVLAELCGEAGVEAYLSGPDIDPLRVASYDAVIVGGGGLVYASRDGANEGQNLANYLKFGPICRRAGVPVGLIGVGDQERRDPGRLTGPGMRGDPLTRRFARSALDCFDLITTRDAASSRLLTAYGASPETGADLLFQWTARARAAVKPSIVQRERIALIGEIYRHSPIAEAFGDGDGPLVTMLHDRDFDVVVMSNDDVVHAERMRDALRRTGASVSIVDARRHSFEALVFLLASYGAVVTTRFHGLVIAMLVGLPVLALDRPGGKNARLLREIDAKRALLLDGVENGVARLRAVLSGRLQPIPAELVDGLATKCDVHRAALESLLGIEDALSASSTIRTHAAAHEKTGARHDHEKYPAALTDADAIPLAWAASSPATAGFANLGDSLSAVMVAALAGRHVKHVDFDSRQTKLVAVGSIGHAIRGGTAVVWGTGVSIRGGVLAQNVPHTRYDIRAVRGPISAGHYRDFGLPVPDVFGDPVWLLPSIVDEPVEPRYELGVIPHIRDVSTHHPDARPRADSLRCLVDEADSSQIAVINTWHEPTWDGLLGKLRLIRSCKRILSQSFHGLVIAEAYGIPTLNFRSLPGAADGAVRIDLEQECNTDPRVWEFYKGGRRPFFYMYSQRRDRRSNWDAAIRSIDELWEPFEYEAGPLVEAFPLPLAYDPLRERAGTLEHVNALRL